MLAKHTATLSPATAKYAPNVVVWTEERSQAFRTICELLCNACALEIPLPQDEFSMVTDASGFGLGAVLQVKRKDGWTAAVFYSRQTRGPERRYSASKLEALAVVESVRHFIPYLYRHKFVVFTDHKPLCSLLTSDHLNVRLKGFSTKLQPWMIQFKYLPGVENTLADALSRQDWRSREGEDTGVTVTYRTGTRGDGERDTRAVQEKKEDETGTTAMPKSGMGGCGGPAPQK